MAAQSGYSVYIAGKIGAAGIAKMRPKFDVAQKYLEWNNWHVVNPCDIPDGETWAACMIADLHAMLDCDALFLLDNWKSSPGATLEMQLALRLGKPVIYQCGVMAGKLTPDGEVVCICPACVLVNVDSSFCPFSQAES